MKKVIFYLLSVALVFGVWVFFAPVIFAQRPTLIIESPKNGEVINKDEALIRLKVENFTISDFRRNPKAVAGQGHLHFWIDQSNPTSQNAIKHISKEPYLLTRLEPKEHTLVVELVANDHSSLNPPVRQTVKFTTTGTPRKEEVIIEPLTPTSTPTPQPTTQAGNNLPAVIIGLIVIIVGTLGLGLIFALQIQKRKKGQPTKKPDQEEA